VFANVSDNGKEINLVQFKDQVLTMLLDTNTDSISEDKSVPR